MKTFQNILLGLLVGVCAGLWLGVNLGKDKPLLSNPFRDATLSERAKWKAEEVYNDTRKALSK